MNYTKEGGGRGHSPIDTPHITDNTLNKNREGPFILDSLRQKPPLPPRLVRVPLADTTYTGTTIASAQMTAKAATTATTPYASMYEEELIEAKQWIQDRIHAVTTTTTTAASREDSSNTTMPFTDSTTTVSPPRPLAPAVEEDDVIELTSSSHDDDNEHNNNDPMEVEDVIPLALYNTTSSDYRGKVRSKETKEEEEEQQANMALQIVADVTYHEKLKHNCLSRWRERTENREAHRKHQTMLADHYYGHVLVYVFYRAWSWRYAQRQRCREKRQEVEAFVERHTRLHCVTLKRQVLAAWQQVVHERHRRNQAALALYKEHVQHPLGKQYFCLWLAFFNRRSVATALEKVSAETCLSSFFQKWKTFQLQQKEHRLKGMVVSLFTPSSWLQRAVEGEKQNSTTIVIDWSALALSSCFRRWLLFTFSAKKSRLQQQEQNLCNLTSKRHTADRSYYFHRWQSRTLSSVLCKELKEALRARYFQNWMTVYTRERAARLFRTARTSERFHHHVFTVWKEKSKQQAQHRRQEQLADAFHKDYALLQFTARQAWTHWRQRLAQRVRYQHMVREASTMRQELLQSLAWHRVVDGAMAQPTPQQKGGNSSGMTPPIPLEPKKDEPPQQQQQQVEEDSAVGGDASLDKTNVHDRTQEMVETLSAVVGTTEEDTKTLAKEEPEPMATASPKKEELNTTPEKAPDSADPHKENTISSEGDVPPPPKPPHYPSFSPYPFPPPFPYFPSPYTYPSPWYNSPQYYPTAPPSAPPLWPPPSLYYGAAAPLSLPPCPQPYSSSTSLTYPPPPPPQYAQPDRSTATTTTTTTHPTQSLYNTNTNQARANAFPFPLPASVPLATEEDGESEGEGFAVSVHRSLPPRLQPKSRNTSATVTKKTNQRVSPRKHYDDRETPSEEEMLFEGKILVQKYKQGKKKKQQCSEELRQLTNELVLLTQHSNNNEDDSDNDDDVLAQMQALQERRRALLACQREQEKVEVELRRFMTWLEQHLASGGTQQRVNLSLDGMSSILDQSA